MCLIVFAVNKHPDYPLILAANRDEFYKRPTAATNFWQDVPSILGGRDLQAGGTWMALHRDGRMAAVTNYRDLSNLKADARSRGELPINYLEGTLDAQEYLSTLDKVSSQYNGFNALIYEAGSMFHYSNYEGKINRIDQDIHGLSNALLDTEWPKVQRLKEDFAKIIEGPFDQEDLFSILANKELAADALLPDTGVPHDLEKMLSAICIQSENYGTCSSSILTISKDGNVAFTERTFAVGDRKKGTVSFTFKHG
jgi:uncharacterized protein with NRDE domain